MLDPATLARRACTNAGGSIAVMVALSLTVMIGFAALGTEVALIYYKQSQMQSVASSAALAGAAALTAGQTSAYAVKEASAVAAFDGFTSGTVGAIVTTVTVNNPPLSGNHEVATAVEVIITQPQPALLSSLFFAGPWNIGARAVATAGNGAADCVLVLDPASFTTSQTSPAYIYNGATLTLTNCGLADNASGPNALGVTGATLKAAAVTITGSDTLSNGGVITTTPTANNVKTGQAATVNPYAGVTIPSVGTCLHGTSTSSQAWDVSTTQTIQPGTYCGGLTISAGTVTMASGTYIINGGYFSVTGGTLTNAAGGVTIVLTGSGSDYAYSTITGGTTTLNALTTGATAGMLIFQNPADPTTATNNTSSFAGGAAANLTGALYFPTQIVSYSNGASSNASSCTQLVAWQILLTGGATFKNSCSGTGVQTIGTTPSALVE
jgi:Flp pilus assembly protein TadG